MLFLHGFFDWLHEVWRLSGSRQFFGFFVGFFFLAEFVQCYALKRLIENAPERFEPNFFGTFGAAFAFSGFFFRGSLFGLGLGLLFSGLGFGAFFLATNNFGGHIRIATMG